MSKEEKESVIPDIIYDEITEKSYFKGRFYGKGGFAKCYQIRESKTQEVFAAKIFNRKMIDEKGYHEDLIHEIAIHRSLNHVNIVGFHSYFTDAHNIYIVLELCKKRSLMELHKRRKAVTEFETRYFMKQILDGVDYLHKNRIIHRDLKLANMFLNDELQVKIGDFGLATKLVHEEERRKTLCGTPNYIAPEIIAKVGHSYEVDVWSIGCIMYTLLVGKPPFETSTLGETYARIMQVQYKAPMNISTSAITMISNTLQGNPSERPSVAKLLEDPFITTGFMPQGLPLSCLTMAPRLDTLEKYNQRGPLSEMNQHVPCNPACEQKPDGSADPQKTRGDIKRMLITLKDQVGAVLSSKPGRQDASSVIEMTDPSAQPFLWVSKWAEYSDEYGFGYQLSDDGVGVMYNDGTRLIMLSNKYNIHYINHEGREFYYTVKDYPQTLKSKMKIMNFFLQYMNERLMKAGGSVAVKQSDCMSRIPYMHQWYRKQTGEAVMQLTNGLVQINFSDHTKIIMCPLMAAVTYIDQEKNFRTYRFETIQQNGCTAALTRSLEFAYRELTRMLEIS